MCYYNKDVVQFTKSHQNLNTKVMKYYLTNFIILFILLSGVSLAEFDLEGFKEATQDIRRIDNFGTDFYLTVPPAYFNENQNNVSIKIYVFSYYETKVKLQVESKAFTESAMVYPETETIFDILPEIAFPFTQTSTLPTSNEEFYKKSALRITSDFPVAVYIVLSGTMQSEGYLALPVSSSGREYVLQSYIDPSSQVSSTINYPAMAGIVNPFDGNKITVIMSNTLKGKVFLNDTTSRVLDKGDTWFVSLKGKTGDLSGVKIISDKPITAITANQIASVPVGSPPTNYLIEQEIPTKAWGHSFHIPRIISRNKSPIFKVAAKDANTEVYLNGILQTTLLSLANSSEYIELRPDVTNPKALDVITASKDISVSVFHPGYSDESTNQDFYKPSRTNLVPYEQYANQMLFNIPRYALENEKSDIFLYLNVQLNSDGSIPDNLEIGYYVNNVLIWKKVANLNILDKKEFKYQFNARRFAQLVIKMTESGNYKLRGDNNFSVTLFASNETGTFSFPAGLPQKFIHSVDHEAPVPNYVMACDGSLIGTTTDKPDNAAIRSNLTTPIFHSNVSNNYDRIFDNVIPGITTSFNWKLNVRDKNQDANAVITFRDYAGNDTIVFFEYIAPKITLTPSVLDFGNTKVNQEYSKLITIKNNSDSTYVITDLPFKYKIRGFALRSNFSQITLNPGDEKQVEITFKSSSRGVFDDSIGVNNNCFSAFKAKVIAQTGSPKIIVTDVFFNDVTLPSTESKFATITNVGENDLTITGWSLSDNVNFTPAFGREISQSKPLIIPPNQSFTFSVIFNPTVEKSFNEQLIFTSDANELDSLCLIKAKAISTGMLTSSYDWQNVRLDISASPEKYLAENAITIKNTGKSNITISKISIESGSINTNNFEIDYLSIIGKTLKENESISLNATFIPRNIGKNELILKFTSNYGSENISTLSAIVVVPKIKPIEETIDFDTTLVNYPSQENSRLIEIVNLSQADWQYADNLTIYEILPQEPKVASLNSNDDSSSYFINVTDIEFPLTLHPGQKLSIPVAFSAKDTGFIETKLYVKSDALNNFEVNLKGYGADRIVSMSGLDLANCLGVPIQGAIQIKNNSVQEIEVEELSIDNQDADFKILDDISSGLKIKPLESKLINVVYTPTGLSSKSVKVYGKLKGEVVPSLTAEITGKTNQYLLSSYLSPVSQTSKIDEDISTKIYLEENPELADFQCDKFLVYMNFTGDFLKLMPNSIELGTTLAGKFKIDNLKINQASGTAEFQLTSLQGVSQILKGEFLKMQFHTYFPTGSSNLGVVSAEIIPMNNSCYILKTSSSNVVLNQTCVDDLRKIQISGNDYYLQGLQQNPVTENQEIEFGIPFNNFTDISIYNHSGTLCNRPVFGDIGKGSYTFILDIKNLSNGIYFLQFKSGEYTKVKKFIIAK
ncbi:MAG: hypothetical protein A2X64_04900 [Ignavibacteria bacterium GWF2_33_9]|nr:MAG: hypothetical protein A2X64_04900 [Ignavibacteria bacterium GWF2_33_9]